MEPAAGELPYQPAIYCANSEPSGARFRARALDIIEQPPDLAPAEIGIHHQAGSLLYHRLMSCRAQIVASPGCAPALPDNSVIQRPSRLAIPKNYSLALIGNAQRSYLLWRYSCLSK